jgi:hypothetical protein
MGTLSLDLSQELAVAQKAARTAGAYLVQRLGTAHYTLLIPAPLHFVAADVALGQVGKNGTSFPIFPAESGLLAARLPSQEVFCSCRWHKSPFLSCKL